MQLKTSKTGKLNTAMVNTAILGIVILVVLFKLYAELVPEAGTQGDLLTDEGRCGTEGYFWNSTDEDCRLSNVTGTVVAPAEYEVPLGGLFSSSGLVFIIIMAALIVVVVKSVMPSGK